MAENIHKIVNYKASKLFFVVNHFFCTFYLYGFELHFLILPVYHPTCLHNTSTKNQQNQLYYDLHERGKIVPNTHKKQN